MTREIRVLIADDQSMVRGALAALLGAEPDISIVSQTGSGTEVCDLARKHEVDVAVLDIDMPDVDGLTAAEQLAEHVPNCKVLIVTTFGRPGYLKRALNAGITGFLVKDAPPDRLAEGIRRVYQGLRLIDPSLAEETLFSADSPLTEREGDIARALLSGKSTAGIAQTLFLSPGTVRNHISSLIAKTNTSNRFEAASNAQERGWI